MSILHNKVIKPESQTSAFALRGGAPALKTYQDMELLEYWHNKHPELRTMSRKERAEFIEARRAQWLEEIKEIDRRRAKSVTQLDRLRSKSDTIKFMLDFAKGALVIEKPDGPSFRRLRKAVADGNAVDVSSDADSRVAALDFEKEVFRFAEVLVVEHDWASALATADLDDAAVRLPYDVCAFEFKFSGRAVIALATQLETQIYVCTAVERENEWILPDIAFSLEAHERRRRTLFNIVGAQIRAICIALDAEVARSDTVRDSHMGKDRHNSYQAPRPYHIVSLARRSARPIPSSGATSGRRVRLHFRRGHWRHFAEHKTWIRWMLVGDPELGFIDKHYLL